MGKFKLPGAVTRTAGKVRLGFEEHSSQIGMIVGFISFGCTIYQTVKGTLKFTEHLKEYESDLDKIKRIEERQEKGDEDAEVMSIDIRKARKEAKVKLVKGGVRSYAKAGLFGLGTVGAFGFVFWDMTKKLVTVGGALSAAVADKVFLEDAVRDKYGEEELQNLMTERKKTGVIDAHVDEKTGEVIEEGEEERLDIHSMFSAVWDRYNSSWDKDPEARRFFLNGREAYANYLLDRRGYLKLNEVRAFFGLKPTKAGEIYGWIRNPLMVHQVSFGIGNLKGDETAIILNFNCDREPIIGRLPMDDK